MLDLHYADTISTCYIFYRELRELSVFRKDIKCHLSKRLSPQLSTWKSLEDICIETIVAKKADFYQAAIIKGSNPFKKLGNCSKSFKINQLSYRQKTHKNLEKSVCYIIIKN